MKERPIIFSGPMVRAISKKRKTQTRRTTGLEDVNKNPDLWELKSVRALNYMAKKSAKGKFGAYFHSEQIEDRTLSVCPQICLYGGPGDRLWVKETFASLTERLIIYRADDKGDKAVDVKWRPSIHMPRWASRITLEIKNVRVERVRDISIDDIKAEGITMPAFDPDSDDKYPDPWEVWADLWNSIYDERGYGWTKNPWVWVIEFAPSD